MRKITTLLFLAIFTLGSMSLFAGGDEWSTIQDAKEKQVKDKKSDKKEKDTKEKKQTSN